jgi:hypothetical protein
VVWGLVFGGAQAASPLGFPWLDASTVLALGLAFVTAVYIGFAVADGRPRVLAVESAVAGVFVLLAASGVTGPAWLLVLGYAGHGLKDLWQERSQFVASTRWWPPRELAAGADAQLLVSVAEVLRDRARAEEQRRRDLPVRPALTL